MGCTDESEKIGGFDKWEVESAVDNLIAAKEIKSKPKFYEIVKKELARKEIAIQAAMLEHKVSKKLKKVYSHNPGKSHGY